jgi:hypothetical protein
MTIILSTKAFILRIFQRKSLIYPSLVVLVILVLVTVTKFWNPFLISESIITKANTVISDVDSFRFSYTITYEISSESNSQQNLEAGFVSPNRYHVTLIEDGQESEFIILEYKLYSRNNNLSGRLLYNFSKGLTETVNKDTALNILNELTYIRELPSEKIDGVNCYHYMGKWNTKNQAQRNKLYSELVPSVEADIEIWIGIEDYFIRQINIDSFLSNDIQGMISNEKSISMKYLYINEPIIIEAPLDKDGQLLPGWKETNISEFINK